jgi:pimeloyl-ACP methyl ester carboxylesterase
MSPVIEKDPNSNGVNVSYAVHGNATYTPPLVLVHGGFSDHWTPNWFKRSVRRPPSWTFPWRSCRLTRRCDAEAGKRQQTHPARASCGEFDEPHW